MNITARIVALLVLVLGMAGLAACDNTIRGIGADVQETGDAVEDATQ